MQLKHQLALTGRMADAEDIVRGANLLQLKSRIVTKVTPSGWRQFPIRR